MKRLCAIIILVLALAAPVASKANLLLLNVGGLASCLVPGFCGAG
jgi:hypothetical protein